MIRKIIFSFLALLILCSPVFASQTYTGQLQIPSYPNSNTSSDGKLRANTNGSACGSSCTYSGSVSFIRANTGAKFKVVLDFPNMNTTVSGVTKVRNHIELTVNDVGTGSISLFDYLGLVSFPNIQYTISELMPPSNVNFFASNVSDTSITLSMSGTDVISYDIYRNNIKVGSTTTNSYTDMNLTPDTNYNYYVVAVNGTGTTSTPEITVKTKSKPKSVTISSSSVSYSTVGLNFSAQYANKIYIYRDGTVIDSVSGTTSSYTDTNVQSSSSYDYWIVAENGYGTTASSIITVKTADPPPPPPPPSNVTISEGTIDYKNVTVTFSATNANSIKLYKDGNVIATLPGTATSFTDNSVQPDTTYQYWIVAENNQGTAASNIITVKTLDKPPVPTQVTISQGPVTLYDVSLNFRANGADTIKVYRDGSLLTTLSGTATIYKDTTAQVQKTYQYWIVAENAGGTAASNIITVETAKPGTITNLRATDKKQDSIRFDWNADPYATSYKVEITTQQKLTASLTWTASPPPTTTTTVTTTVNSITVNNLQAGQNVSLSVTAYNSVFGYYGTATTSATTPLISVPTNSTPPNPNDLFNMTMSFASNFWLWFILGCCFFLVPWIYSVARSALGKKSVTEISSPKRASRVSAREIRGQLREDKT